MTMPQSINRRNFLLNAAAAGTSLTLSAASYGRVAGSNERLGIAFLGCGARAQAHLDLLQRLGRECGNVAVVGVADVWDGLEEEYDHAFAGRTTKRRYLQGLLPTARKAGLEPNDAKRVTKDHRVLLDLPDADIVVIAAPDHWHARMLKDSLGACKHILCERPVCKTITETIELADILAKTQQVISVGLQTLADPSWMKAREILLAGRLGHAAHAQTHFFRNDIRGYGRYYRLAEAMSPQSVDWQRFTGMERPPAFDRARFAQWRCYEAFSAGPFVEALLPNIARMMTALAVKAPRRVTALGDIVLEHDGREIPDLATLVADFDEGCQLVATACTTSAYPNEEVIRGRHGALRFTSRGMDLFADDPAGGAGLPVRIGDRPLAPAERIEIAKPANETLALWEDFLDCVRNNRKQTLGSPETALHAGLLALMAVESLRTGQTLAWDAEHKVVLPAVRFKPRKMARRTDVRPPEYQKLAGEWKEAT